MSITEDVLLSFSGCSTLAEIEDLVLRDQGLNSIQVDTDRQVLPPVLVPHNCLGFAAMYATSNSIVGPQFIVAC
jgi:hypothetical protein